MMSAYIRADHPSNAKRGGVCIYYEEHLPLSTKIGICKLNECVVTEINVNNDHQIKIKSSLSLFTKTS